MTGDAASAGEVPTASSSSPSADGGAAGAGAPAQAVVVADGTVAAAKMDELDIAALERLDVLCYAL